MEKPRRLRKATKRPPITKIFVFALISSFLIIFCGLIIYDSPILIKAVLFAGSLFFAEGLSFIIIEMSSKKQKFKNCLAVVASITLAAAFTFSLNIWGMGPVVAAALVGFFYTIFAEMAGNWLKNLSAPVYCGTFVGMCAKFIFTDLWMVGLAGAFAGLVYVISDGVFEGVGGKLGTIAFIGSFSIGILMSSMGFV